MTYKSKIIRKLLIGSVLFAIICAFYLSGMYLWGADQYSNSILNIIFSLASLALGIVIESLFKVKDFQEELMEMPKIERIAVIEHCNSLNQIDDKILQLNFKDKKLSIKAKYKDVIGK